MSLTKSILDHMKKRSHVIHKLFSWDHLLVTFTTVTGIQPNFVNNFVRASILERHFTNRLDEAEADYTKSISLNSDYVEGT